MILMHTAQTKLRNLVSKRSQTQSKHWMRLVNAYSCCRILQNRALLEQRGRGAGEDSYEGSQRASERVKFGCF